MKAVHIVAAAMLGYIGMNAYDRLAAEYGSGRDATGRTALSLVPELHAVAKKVVDIAPPNQDMNARNVAKHIDRFARVYYRATGKAAMSPCEREKVLGDASMVRAQAVNALQALYISSRRNSHRRALDECTAELMHHTDIAIRSIRRLIGKPNTYAAGRGFPVGLAPDHDPAYDKVLG